MPSTRLLKWLRGFTLVEIILGGAVLTIGVAALVGAYLSQAFLNTNARNLTLAMRDATRVMEEIRRQNMGCPQAFPSAAPPGSFENKSWDAWLNAQTPAKSLAGALETIAVTCQNETGTQYCGRKATGGNRRQAGDDEWFSPPNLELNLDPIRVTVAVGWVQNGRAMGGREFVYSAVNQTLTPQDTNVINTVIDSQAMISTVITCRSITPATTSPPATTGAPPPPTS